VTMTHDNEAVLILMKKGMKSRGSPDTMTTAGLRPYRAAMKKFGNVESRRSRDGL